MEEEGKGGGGGLRTHFEPKLVGRADFCHGDFRDNSFRLKEQLRLSVVDLNSHGRHSYMDVSFSLLESKL